ncbi:MAG: hypothetical protein K2Y37_12065 [Pirellulales bacterium]|nr:hypothetical protein [Pirellulales bacterium]
MEFDRTRIPIRERTYPDVLDLALSVTREHAGQLLCLLVLGAAPLVAFNQWFLGSDVATYLFDPELPIEETVPMWLAFAYMMCVLLVIEIPLATAPMTLYLGQALFVEKVDWRRLARDYVRNLPQLLYFQLFVRALAAPWVISWFFLYSFWPYLNEVILLENNPWRQRKSTARLSTLARSRVLHASNAGDLLARWLGSLLLAVLLVTSTTATLWVLRCILLEEYEEVDSTLITVYLQAGIWLVVGYFTVVRFLSYLDLRIRSEGWELELRMRAAATRLTRSPA